jgi:quinol monooxygenase YgiN
MRRSALPIGLLISLVAKLTSAQLQTETAPADPRFFAVSYLDAAPSATRQLFAAFKAYSEATAKEDGHLGFELFEQAGRPAHYAVVETWRDQKAFEAGRSAAQPRLLDQLKPVVLGGYDQRPYKPLLAVLSPAAPPGGAVSVITHVDVAPDPRVAALLKRHAEASRMDGGNLRFDVLQHATRGNHFTVIETWSGQKALDDHAAATHTRQYRDELQPLTGSPLDERIYKQLRPTR